MMKVLHTFLCEKRKLKMVKKSQRTQEEKVLKQHKCACFFVLFWFCFTPAESAYILTWLCSFRGWILWFSVKWGKVQKIRCWLSTNNSLTTIFPPSQYIRYIFYETFNELYCKIQEQEKDLPLWVVSLPLKYPS